MRFHILDRCNSFNNGRCDSLRSIHVIKVTAPSLCPTCFRRKEALIDAEYEKATRDLRHEIARLDEGIAKGRATADEQVVRRLQGYRAECKDDVSHAKASRDMSIRLFRQNQGVWGDG